MEIDKTLKIIFFSFGVLEQGGGFENYLIDTSSGLSKRFTNVHSKILTSDFKTTKHLQAFLSLYFLKKHHQNNTNRESRSKIIKRLGQVVYENFDSKSKLFESLKDCDVIYTKNEILELAMLKIIGYRNLPPIIVGIHTPLHYPHTKSVNDRIHNVLYTGIFYKFLLKGTKAIKTNNDEDKKFILSRFNYKNVFVINHGFNAPESKKNKLVKKDSLNILFAGRLTEQKGIDILIKLIESMSKKDNFDKFSFRVAGSGEELYQKKLTSLSNLYSNISYHGHVANNNLSEFYDWCDIVVAPSRYETLNRVAVEACLATKIIVTTDISGPREFITHNHNGFLLPLNRVAFENTINHILNLKINNEKIFYNIGINARKDALSKFDKQKSYEQLYKKLQANV